MKRTIKEPEVKPPSEQSISSGNSQNYINRMPVVLPSTKMAAPETVCPAIRFWQHMRIRIEFTCNPHFVRITIDLVQSILSLPYPIDKLRRMDAREKRKEC